MADENLLDARWNAAKQRLLDAANAAGVDPGVLVKIAGFESGFDPHARPIAGRRRAQLNTVAQFDGTRAMSSAYGYGQFLDGTWIDMVRRHGEKYGVENASLLTDEEANSDSMRNNTTLQAGVLAEFTRINVAKGEALGGSDVSANVYAMHNLGGGDGPRFLRAMATRPGARVDSVLSKAVIERNSALYADGSISLSDAYKNMGAQMERYSQYAGEVSQGYVARVRDDAQSHVAATRERVLREGMHGDDVRELQSRLARLGFTDSRGRRLSEDGDFGPTTHAAVQAFQRDHALTADGIAGNTTHRAVDRAVQEELRSIGQRNADYLRLDEPDSALSAYRELDVDLDPSPALMPITRTEPLGPDALRTASAPHVDEADIRTLQRNLNTLGFTDLRGERLVVHGVYDIATEIAVMQFQSERGLPATGQADEITRTTAQGNAFIAELQQVGSPVASQIGAAHEVTRAWSAPRGSASTHSDHALDDPRHPLNSDHDLYNELRRSVPDASENRLLQFTAVCHKNRITADNLSLVHLDEEGMTLSFRGSGPLTTAAQVDLNSPPPQPQEAINAIQQCDQQRVQMLQEFQSQNAQLSRGGPTM